MPTLILSTACGCSRIHLFLRHPLRAIFGSKKLAGMLSEYFRFGISKYVLSTTIPISYQPIRISHENRIVTDCLYRLAVDVFRAAIHSAAVVCGCHNVLITFTPTWVTNKNLTAVSYTHLRA